MIKVITYGTYDNLHRGHIRLLERAKALGDYLIVGVTAEDFDKVRGKINVEQSLVERMDAVRATGLADEIIVEEYEGQKIDDIRRYGVDIFTVGSDWVGKFDYLKEYCDVVYLERTEGISSTEIRSKKQSLKIAFIGKGPVVEKYHSESAFVNGMECVAHLSVDDSKASFESSYRELLENVDAIFLATHPKNHFQQIQTALKKGVHVLCESPLTEKEEDCRLLQSAAKANNLVLMEAIKTAYSTAYNRLLLLAKSGRIGRIISVDSVCTGLGRVNSSKSTTDDEWQDAMEYWAPTACLPIFQLLGTAEFSDSYVAYCDKQRGGLSDFVKANFRYPASVGSFRVGRSVKAEGELIVSGTEGYIYVPAPWWKTDYFEIRHEDPSLNKRYFYQLDGEGIRNQLLTFARTIEKGKSLSGVSPEESLAISRVMEHFKSEEYTVLFS